nr:hypothetical protein [Tanacetum cinerariifolium]
MEVVREYPDDERTAAARTGLVGPAGVPRGVAGMSNRLGLCRRQLGQQWSCVRACTMKHGNRSPVLNPSRVPYTGMARSSDATLVAGRGKSHTISVIRTWMSQEQLERRSCRRKITMIP